jgi:hypothetical protein
MEGPFLNGIEQGIIQTQVDSQSGLCRASIHCQESQRVKDTRERQLDTMFGRVTVRCRRFIRRRCRGGKARSRWPLVHCAEFGMKRNKVITLAVARKMVVAPHTKAERDHGAGVVALVRDGGGSILHELRHSLEIALVEGTFESKLYAILSRRVHMAPGLAYSSFCCGALPCDEDVEFSLIRSKTDRRVRPR